MEKSHSESYKAAGVDVTAGYRAVELMKTHIESTKTGGVLSSIGGFGGLFRPDLSGMSEPVLVSGTDGVGTKLKIAFLLDKHDTIGIDCVAMCVNDIICCGAAPLFFLDYIAMGKNYPEKVASIVSGVAKGCVMAGAALIGGESAELPGMYQDNEYDLAGFSVGIVDRSKLIDPSNVKIGDVIIALQSSGVHSNGFSLVRKIFSDMKAYSPELGGMLGEALLTPTKIYVKPILALKEKIAVKAIANITGGGFYENIPRIIPKNMTAQIELALIDTPPVFSLIQRDGNIPQRDMFNTFNMGVGMCVVVGREDADNAVALLGAQGEHAKIIGEIVSGCGSVEIV